MFDLFLQQNVDDNIQLGPGGRSGYGGWVHGSSGGGKTSSQEGERSSTPSNRSVKLHTSLTLVIRLNKFILYRINYRLFMCC